ncbi:sulfatase-like hydrolase/transferase [Sulfurovum sp. CS9]|uniref:sulfatase-like hydrolase/transferase n=1 Tax=Sulfurovum sp. CS9 TaxID=3391146 RepID=UPI0039E85DB0
MNPEQKKIAAKLMETYAGFSAQTDYEAGLLIEALEEMGEFDNTLFIYMVGDNGASSEGQEHGMFNEVASLNGFSEDPKTIIEKADLIGTAKAFNHYPAGFAWAMNTPFQWVKLVASHYGGTSNPVIMSWPNKIKDVGGKRLQFHHVVDIAPTIYEAIGIDFPEYVNGIKQIPLEGVSMVSTWDKANTNAVSKHKTQYFELFGNRGIWHEGWYACTKHGDYPWRLSATKKFDNDRWELYDTSKDFSQANDLAEQYPEKLKALQALFDVEARNHNVYPLDDRGGARFNPANLPLVGGSRKIFTYYPGATRIPERSAPYTLGRDYSITATFDNSKGDSEGVVVSIGGVSGGWSLYVKEGKLHYVFNDFSESLHTIISAKTLPKGKVIAVVNFKSDKGGLGKGANIELSINGEIVGKTRTERTPRAAFSLDETLDIGADYGSPVGEYKAGSVFKGSLEKVVIELK